MLNRDTILSLRPAPIQVNFLGYPGTLGPNLCDYVITDTFCTPVGSAEESTEALAVLPHSYLTRECRDFVQAPPSRTTAGLGFVFCCFNQAYKFTPAVFDVWCQLLQCVPESVLWLLANDEAEGNLRGEAWNRVVDGSRLIFAKDLPHAQHLERLQSADLVLDTWSYCAHTTASGDALRVGVPIITRPGTTFASRVAGSLLRAVGQSQLIVEGQDNYLDLAYALAVDAAQLKELGKALVLERSSAPLFKVKAYTLALESLYERTWDQHQLSLLPAPL